MIISLGVASNDVAILMMKICKRCSTGRKIGGLKAHTGSVKAIATGAIEL
jgi:hypothetical protein